MDSVRVGGWLILANLVRRHPGTHSVLFWGALLPLTILFLLYYLRMLGAADLKLLSVVGGIHRTKENFGLYAL